MVAACSDVRLERPIETRELEEVDRFLSLRGELCESPAPEVDFPVKVMFVVDGSGSQQFSDQNRQRVVAVEQTVNRLLGSANTSFKVVVFNAAITSTPPAIGDPPPPPFTNDPTALTEALAALAEADSLTDYQGALALAYAELLRDMTAVQTDPNAGPATLGRTRYVIILISDGLPDPQCQVGVGNDFDPNFPDGVNRLCEDQNFLSCLQMAEGARCGFGGGGRECSDDRCREDVCNFDGTACFRNPDGPMLFGGASNTELVAGGDYNQPYQILQKIQDIMDLGERFQLGEIRVHSGLVLDPDLDPAVAEVFGDPAQAVPLMQQVATIGEGRFLEFYGGDEIDFVDIDFDSLQKPRVLTGLFVRNLSGLPVEGSEVVDTDFDGLPDDLEYEIGSSPLYADTDSDGFGDLVEWTQRARGLDLLDPCSPGGVDVVGVDPNTECDPLAPVSCDFEWRRDPETQDRFRVYLDSDGDGLHDCEERSLGSDPRNADTDRDGLPDRLDLAVGLDPLVSDADLDTDRDGIHNAREVAWFTDPAAPDDERRGLQRTRYERPPVGSTADGRTCYGFRISDIALLPTADSLDIPARGVGMNELRLLAVERLTDDPGGRPVFRQACVRARYAPPSLKVPASGELTLGPEDFHYLPGDDPLFTDLDILGDLFDADRHCIEAR